MIRGFIENDWYGNSNTTYNFQAQNLTILQFVTYVLFEYLLMVWIYTWGEMII